MQVQTNRYFSCWQGYVRSTESADLEVAGCSEINGLVVSLPSKLHPPVGSLAGSRVVSSSVGMIADYLLNTRPILLKRIQQIGKIQEPRSPHVDAGTMTAVTRARYSSSVDLRNTCTEIIVSPRRLSDTLKCAVADPLTQHATYQK